MPPTQKFEECVVRVEKPSVHFTLLRNEKGDFLGTSEGKKAVFDHVDEAPPGSYVIYDARTWHRAGVNRTNRKRAAMLQSVVPMYIMPFMETSRPYKEFLASPLASQLTEREHIELESLLVSRIDGPRGRLAITMDEELSNGGVL